MRNIIPSLTVLAFLLLGGPVSVANSNDQPVPDSESAVPEVGEQVVVTLQVPFGSPLFSETPVATVEDEPITFSDLTKSLAAVHSGLGSDVAVAKQDYANLLNRIIIGKLIVQEARNIGLDELSAIVKQVDAFSEQLLRSELVSRYVKDVEADAEELDELYKKRAREFLITTVEFQKEEDALSFESEVVAGADFNEVAKRFIEDGKGEGKIGAEQYVKLKDLLPTIAKAAFTMELGSVSQIFKSQKGYLLFCVEDSRLYEDPEVKANARQEIIRRLKREKSFEYGEDLEAKYVTLDEKLLKRVSFERRKTGFLWRGEGKPVDYKALLSDQRVLATIEDDEPYTITVADVAKALEKKYFHGAKSAFEKGTQLDVKKQIILQNMLFNRTSLIEARRLGLDKTDEYLKAIEEHTDSLLFGAFINKVVAPDVKLTEDEIEQYYKRHIAEYSTPKMLRLNGIVFYSKADAEDALNKLRKAADFNWVSANSPGQVDTSDEDVFIFTKQLLSLTALPEDLQELLQDARTGDSVLYSSSDSYHHAVAVDTVISPRPEAYESARGKIAKIIFNEKVKALVDEWSEKLKDVYETRIFVRGLDE